jgi:DNA-directed RNA polymerase specialized sigma24 family protein
MTKTILYDTVRITFQPLDDQMVYKEMEKDLSVIGILGLIGHLPLKQQVYMMVNLLTISGYTQEELAKEMGVAHKTFRNHICDTRKMLKDKRQDF